MCNLITLTQKNEVTTWDFCNLTLYLPSAFASMIIKLSLKLHQTDVVGTKGKPSQDLQLWHREDFELKTIKARKTQKEALTSPILQLHKKNLDKGTVPGGELSP